jgi:acetyl esterase
MTATTEPGPLTDGSAAFPHPGPIRGSGGEVRHESIVYSCEAGYRPLFLDLRVPKAATSDYPCPLVVWVHGGGWIHGSRRRQAPNLHRNRVIERIVEAGFAVALVDYRLAKEAPFPAQALDLKAAVRWLRGHASEFFLDPRRFALWGESAGAHLALMASFCDRFDDERSGEFRSESEAIQAVIDWYGPADLATALSTTGAADSEETGASDEHPVRTLLAGSTWTAENLSPLRHVRADVPPVFIAHGRDDRQVDVEQSRRFHETLIKAGATTEYLETAGDHVFVGAEVLSEVTDSSLDFLRKHLGPGTISGLDPAIIAMERSMAATGDYPIFVDSRSSPVDAATARARGVRLRDNFYPKQFFDVQSVTDETIAGPAGEIRIRIQKPLGGSDATVIYFHGGGWIIGDLDSHQANGSRIAAQAKAHVIQVDYRLAPEHPFPAGVEDALAALDWVIANIERFGGNPAKLVVAGDSAGGNLAAVAAQHCREQGIRLAAQFLIYPATDLSVSMDGGVESQYLGPEAASLASNPQVSPALAGRLDGLAPAVIGVGVHDFLYQDNVRYARKLADAGVTVVFRQYPTLNHGFFSYGNVSTASDRAAEQMCKDLYRILHS